VGPGKDLPYEEWTTHNLKVNPMVAGDPFLDTVYDQPAIRNIITTMYGTDQVGVPTGWSGKRDYQLFLTPYTPAPGAPGAPERQPRQLRGGHIDFGGNIIPLFGNAFVIQVCLRDTEPFGGNITIIPGSARVVQQRAIKDPLTQFPYDFKDFEFAEPYEHVAKAGDVILMHHLSFHSGNPAIGATRRPRIALHCQAHRTTFLTKADPGDASNPPWVRSFALNGYVEDPNDEQRYITFCENKKAMWGYWSSEDGRVRAKVFTWVDGLLRARIRWNDATEFFPPLPRFDGKDLKFEQPVDPAMAAGIGLAGNAGAGSAGGVQTAEAVRSRVEMRLDPADPERMHYTLIPADGGAPVIVTLKRTGAITGRVLDDPGR
jgi:hypothetical protein